VGATSTPSLPQGPNLTLDNTESAFVYFSAMGTVTPEGKMEARPQNTRAFGVYPAQGEGPGAPVS